MIIDNPSLHRFIHVTRDDVTALIEHSLAPPFSHRALCIALHYQCFLQSADLAGTWARADSGYVPRQGELTSGSFIWRGLTMEDIKIDGDLTIRLRSAPQPLVFDAGACDLVTGVISTFTKRQRTGAVGCSSRRQPWPDIHSYVESIRGLVRAASYMERVRDRNIGPADLRVSGIQEAVEAGASLDAIHARATCGGRLSAPWINEPR